MKTQYLKISQKTNGSSSSVLETLDSTICKVPSNSEIGQSLSIIKSGHNFPHHFTGDYHIYLVAHINLMQQIRAEKQVNFPNELTA